MFLLSTLKIPNNPRLKTRLILFLATLISVGAYLLASDIHLRIGFPLDDAWIHQVYARNLANHGDWAFTPGKPSGGSTSPLWTVLLIPSYLLHVSPFLWTFLLAGTVLLVMAVLIEQAARHLVKDYDPKFPWVGLLVIFEWHFTWSAASGMETILQGMVFLLGTILLLRQKPPWFILGLLAGFSTLVRPDGITLIGPILFAGMMVESTRRNRAYSLLSACTGFIIILVPYLLFQYSLSGRIFPTTFYAKQAEYTGWQENSIIGRSSEVLISFITGSAILLLPGFLMGVIDAVRMRKWGMMAIILWILGYLSIYMLRLPPYQHGRYLIPAMPSFFLISICAILAFFHTHRERKLWKLLRISWAMALTLVCLGFWILGLNAYITDVEFVETEMVATARWVSINIPEDAILAAHDIGAMGYFCAQELVDMAGLINPEVTSFFLDEYNLANYLDSKNVDYLIVFPDWYPALSNNLDIVFTTGAAYAPSVGEKNLTVYKWQNP